MRCRANTRGEAINSFLKTVMLMRTVRALSKEECIVEDTIHRGMNRKHEFVIWLQKKGQKNPTFDKVQKINTMLFNTRWSDVRAELVKSDDKFIKRAVVKMDQLEKKFKELPPEKLW
jgi:hypothetical protein